MAQPIEGQDQSQIINEPAPVPYARLWLVAACLVVYVKFLNNPIVFDDANIFDFKLIQRYADALFFDFSQRWFSYVTFGWTYKFVGTNIIWHRAINLTLHLSVVLALYAFLKKLFQSTLPAGAKTRYQTERFAFWGALIFAVHPVAVYAVGYLVERSVVMATLFAVLALHAFLKGLCGNGRKWYLLAAGWYFIAVFSKEHVVMLPLAMAAIIPLVRKDFRSVIRELALPLLPLIGIALMIVLERKGLFGVVYESRGLEMLAQAGSNEIQSASVENSHFLSALLQSYLFFKYLLLWLVPNVGWMSVDLQQKFPNTWLQWPESVGVLIYIVYPIAMGRLLWRGGRRGLLGYALLFPWMMYPTEFFSVRIVEPFVLYRSYLWMVCLPVAMPVILGKQEARRENMVLAMVVVGLVLLSWNRLNTFSSNVKLWDDVITKLPDEKTVRMGRIYLNRGVYRSVEGGPPHYEEALADLNMAVALGYHKYAVYTTRGGIKNHMKQYLDAYEDFNRAIEINPKRAEAYFNRGLSQLGLGNMDKAMSDISYAIELQPGNKQFLNVQSKLREVTK